MEFYPSFQKLSVVNERSKNGLEIVPFVSEPRTAFTVNLLHQLVYYRRNKRLATWNATCY